MKYLATPLLLLTLLSVAVAQNPPAPAPASGARTDVYHVFFAKAALGKAAEFGDYLKTPNPKAPMPGHSIVLRHQEGDEWDYVVIDHLGTKYTVDAAGNPPPAAARDLGAWHGDTFVSGPSWAEFSKAMGIGPDAATTANSLYVVTVLRAAPGHRQQLEQLLTTPPSPGGNTPPAPSVMLQHLEGAPWQYLTITRYNSWQDYATSDSSGLAQTRKGTGPWFQLRDHADFHRDTLADRLAP